MLFSDEIDELKKELKGILPFGDGFNFGNFLNVLLDTERRYILTLIGENLYNRLSEDVALDKERDMCRKAIANIAVYENFTLLNTKILAGGFARLTGENTSSLYKYQETELKKSFRRNGFDELDRIVGHFLSHIGDFPEFRETEYYQQTRGELIPDRMVFSRYYKPVGHIVFQFMRPFIHRAETLDIAQVVNVSELKTGILENTLTDVQKCTLDLVRPVVVSLAVAYAIDDKGVNITDTGIWLENRVAGDGGTEENPAAETAGEVAHKYRILAERYLKELQKHLSGCDNINPLIRDNKGKKTVWR